jgi:AcrR family transcriptional regulator
MAAAKRKGSTRVEAAELRRHRVAALAREDILRAAATAFATRGYQAATLQQIAAAAGFTAASLYTYFPGKEAIFRELGNTVISEIAAPFRRKLAGNLSFPERIQALIEAECEVARRRRDAFTFFMRLMDRCDSAPGKVRNHGQELLDLCEQWMRRNAPSAGLLVSADEAGLVLWSILNAFIYRWVTADPPEPLEPTIARIQNVFLHGVMGSRTPNASPRTSSRKV